jgi:hypothetical protein
MGENNSNVCGFSTWITQSCLTFLSFDANEDKEDTFYPTKYMVWWDSHKLSKDDSWSHVGWSKEEEAYKIVSDQSFFHEKAERVVRYLYVGRASKKNHTASPNLDLFA